jgi:hypothetical protein
VYEVLDFQRRVRSIPLLDLLGLTLFLHSLGSTYEKSAKATIIKPKTTGHSTHGVGLLAVGRGGVSS